MRMMHKLELAYARAKQARAKIRNARPYAATNSDWLLAEKHLDHAMSAISGLMLAQREYENEKEHGTNEQF